VVAPVFLVFILGILEVGRSLMVQHLLLSAAREGCRTGILPNNGATQIDNAVSTTLASAGITSQSVTVLVNNASADPAKANSGDTITVTVTVPFAAVTWLPFSDYVPGNLSAQYALLKQ
jgi:Flp pilus assembly protein TadG